MGRADDALVTSATQGLGLLAHAVIVLTLTLVFGLGIDIDAKRLVANYLGLRPKPLTLGNAQTSLALLSLNRGFHRALVAVARIVVQVERKLLSVFDFTCTEGHGFANVRHNLI